MFDLKSVPLISLIANFDAKIKIFKFGSNNILFGYFGRNLIILLSYLKSAPSNLVQKKKKSLNLRRKMSFLSILELEFENNILMFKVSGIEFGQLQNFVEK